MTPSPAAPAQPVASWKGPASLRSLLVPVDTLREDPANARLHPERNLAALVRSLDTFGQQKPIVVRQDGIVLAGNGTLRSAIALGWTHVAALTTDLDVSQGRAFAIADNRTSELAAWNMATLAETLVDLRALNEQLALAAGFDASELDALAEASKRALDGVADGGASQTSTTNGLRTFAVLLTEDEVAEAREAFDAVANADDRFKNLPRGEKWGKVFMGFVRTARTGSASAHAGDGDDPAL